MARILFSPIGDTDPVRYCYDGACLHIVRHYHPDKVVLFLTKAMSEKEKNSQRYSKSIKHVAPNCQIDIIHTDIEAAHLYDSFIDILPAEVHKINTEENEVLLNLSSGTPQIKTVMAILSVENDLKGIQVISPNKASNSQTPHMEDEDDIEAVLQNNFDEYPDAENRCQEPPLQTIRAFGERQRLLSLIHMYEYAGAYSLIKGSSHISQEIKNIVHHAVLRQKMLKNEARKILSVVDGMKLFSNVSSIRNKGQQEKVENLIEYLLNVIITQRKGYIGELLVKCNSYLCELLLYHINNNSKVKLSECMSGERLSRHKLQNMYPELLEYLDKIFCPEGFRSGAPNLGVLCNICYYIDERALVVNQDGHDSMVAILHKIADNDGFRKMRNSAAHNIANTNEERLVSMLGMHSQELLHLLVKLSDYILPVDVKKASSVYDILNQAVEKRIMV